MTTENISANKYKTVYCLGFNIYADTLSKISLSKKTLINTINQYSYCITQQDNEFKKALLQSDILLPDGVGITFAAKFFDNEHVKKIAGADMHKFLLEKCLNESKSCFYLGSSIHTLNKIKSRLSVEYPDIKAGFYSPPYKAQFTNEDNLEMINAVNAFKPDVLFIGMTAPKQEKWAFEHRDNLNTYIICSIGAVFDFYAGTVKRPNKIWIKLGLEWFIRLVKEPKRMSKRYLYYGPLFVGTLFKVRLNSLFKKSNLKTVK
jgi:N-acetylglucosaminyldiphosphoundecaprenol N-acetyl-beta-D-mannosaminyltransferase